MPVNYAISSVNDFSGTCPHCNGQGCKFCRKLTCPSCNGIITGDDGCPACLGTKHGFTSDLIQQTNISLPDPSARPYAGESNNPPRQIRIGRH